MHYVNALRDFHQSQQNFPFQKNTPVMISC